MNNIKGDPFSNPENEYLKLKQQFIFEYGLRTANITTDEDLVMFEHDLTLLEWEKEQREKIDQAFFRLKAELDKENIFYFSCPFKNYEASYTQRLKEFITKLYDATETDFINSELEYLKNTLYDIEHCESSHDSYSITGIDNFSFTFSIVEKIGYEQYLLSTNKKIEFLQNRLITLPPQTININGSRTKKVIFETFANIDKQGWEYAFVSEQDYNLFVDLLTNFFEYQPYTLPEAKIQLKRTCKTKLAKALGEIHKELSNENKLTTDTKYFQLIKVLSHFEKETNGDLYKALTR